MRWYVLAVCFFYIFYSVNSEPDPNSSEPKLEVLARSSVYNVGEKKAIYCKGSNLKQRMKWISPNGEEVEARSSRNIRVFVERHKNESLVSSLIPLIFQSIQMEDSGKWICKSGDELSAEIEILVGEKVNITESSVDYVGEQYKTAKLECVAKGYPEPVVQWSKDGQVIVADKNKYSISNRGSSHILEIKKLSYTDRGTYVCKLTQERLTHYTFKLFNLTVKHIPVITYPVPTKYKLKEEYAILNEIKNLTCGAIADPLPTFTWAKRVDGFDQVIDDPDSILVSEDGTSSVLLLKVYNESALGEYKCSVHNIKGKEYIIFDVTLGNKPNLPSYVELVSATASNLTFNVTCDNCVFEEPEGESPKPNNLNVLGYNFEFVPYVEGYGVANWINATKIQVDIEAANDTLFTVGPLDKETTYYARVATRNAAGLSDWYNIEPNPVTKGAAVVVLSAALQIAALLAILFS